VSLHTWLEVQSIDREEGSIKCLNRVQIFGGHCDFCLVCFLKRNRVVPTLTLNVYWIAGTIMPINKLLPHPSSPSSEDVKAMNGTIWRNKAAATTPGGRRTMLLLDQSRNSSYTSG
jgi:hypothetical protein